MLERTLGPGALAPHQIVVDTHRPGGASDPAVVAAQRRLVAALRRDREVEPETIAAPAFVPRVQARQANLVDADGRVLQVRAAGHSDSGTAAAKDLVKRIRDRYIPAARFPASPTSCSAARRPSASTSSTRPTAPSRGSCSRC